MKELSLPTPTEIEGMSLDYQFELVYRNMEILNNIKNKNYEK